MKYVFIDSNIYLTCAGLRVHGHNPSLLGRLVRHTKNNDAVLLLPEVVDAEVRRILSGGTNEKFVTKTLDGKDVQHIALTPEAMSRAMLWTIRGDRPARKNTVAWGDPDKVMEALGFMRFRYGVEQDCLILASLTEFMADKSEDELVICTSDKAWFAEGSLAQSIANQFQTEVAAYDDLIVLLKDEFGVDVNAEIKAEYAEVSASLAAMQRSITPALVRVSQEIQQTLQSPALNIQLQETLIGVARILEVNQSQIASVAQVASAAYMKIAKDLEQSQKVIARVYGADMGRYVRELNRQNDIILRWVAASPPVQDNDAD